MKTSNRSTRFSAAHIEALFDAVLDDDVVDAQVTLPENLPMPQGDALLADCFSLAHQLWREGVDANAFNTLLTRLIAQGDLEEQDRLLYKYARAKFKHLRFAFVLYDRRHRSPNLFKWLTALQGHLQDAFRNRRRLAVIGLALALRLLLSKPGWWVLRREAASVRLDDARGFCRFLDAEIATVRAAMGDSHLSGREFHSLRKIASRYVSFIDTFRTLRPSEDLRKTSRYLAAINGLMGSMHDELVQRRSEGTGHDHRDPIEIPEDIARLWRGLLTRFNPIAPC